MAAHQQWRISVNRNMSGSVIDIWVFRYLFDHQTEDRFNALYHRVANGFLAFFLSVSFH